MLARKPDIGFRWTAQDLGVSKSLLRKWAELSAMEGSDAFRCHGMRTEQEARTAALKRESPDKGEADGVRHDLGLRAL